MQNNSSPLITDWDNDGDFDLLVGQKGASEYSSDIKIFLNNGSKDNYNFQSSGSVSVNGNSLLHQFYRAQLDYIDLDEDGLKDLIIANANSGTSKGNVGFLKNTGTISAPAFSEWILIKADGNDISMLTQQGAASKYDARARVVDWDGDGVLDILAACDNIFFYKGSGESVGNAKQIENVTSAISILENNGIIKFKINSTNHKDVSAELLHFNGRLIYKINCLNKEGYISGTLNNITSGSYLLKINDGNRINIKQVVVK